MGAKAKISDTGEVMLPKALRDAYGLKPGAEIDIADDGRRILLTPEVVETSQDGRKKLTLEEFLAMRVSYDGPPVNDRMMREAIDRVAIEDWKRLERQWNEDKDD